MVTSSRILDILALAVKQYKVYGKRGIESTFDHMNSDERVAFDFFLVKMGDQLAYQAGTVEYRFTARVLAMANNVPLNEALADAQEGSEG